jgi:hypothetical protein
MDDFIYTSNEKYTFPSPENRSIPWNRGLARPNGFIRTDAMISFRALSKGMPEQVRQVSLLWF